MNRERGFTLVELVVVMVITAILATMTFQIIRLPFEGYALAQTRMALTNRASIALIQMSRDVRAALPNSLRTNGTALEVLQTRGAARYRADPPGTAADILSFTAADSAFNVLNDMNALGSFPGLRLAVYPLGIPGADPYVDNVLTPALTVLTVAPIVSPVLGYDNEFRVTIAPAHLFPLESPDQRLFLVNGPVSYVCVGDELRRYTGYALSAAQPVVPGDFSVTATVILKGMSNCTISYNITGANQGLVSLRLGISERGQAISLVQQVHVENTP